MSSSFHKFWKKNRAQIIVVALGIIAFTAFAVASSQYSSLIQTSVTGGGTIVDPRCTCACKSGDSPTLCQASIIAGHCTAELRNYTFGLTGPYDNYTAVSDACNALENTQACEGFRLDPSKPGKELYEVGVLHLCTPETIPTKQPTSTPTPTPKPTPTPPPSSPEAPCLADSSGICIKSAVSSIAGEGCYVAGGSLTMTVTAESTDEDRKLGSTRMYPIKFYDEGGTYIPYLLRPNFDPFAFFYGLSGRIWIPQVFGSKVYTVRGTVNEDIPRRTVLRWTVDVKTGWGDDSTTSAVIEVPACTQGTSEKEYQFPFFGGSKSQRFSATEWDSMSSQAQEDVKRKVAAEAELTCNGQAQYLNHCSHVIYNVASGQVKSEQGGPVYNVQRDANEQVRVLNPNEPGIAPADPIRPECSDVRLCPSNNYQKASCELTGTYADVPDVQVSRRFSTLIRKMEYVTISASSLCATTCACKADSAE